MALRSMQSEGIVSINNELAKSHAPVVSVLGAGYYTLLNFLRHLLFTQLRILRLTLGRFVSITSKHGRIPE